MSENQEAKPEADICWILNYRVKKDISKKTLARLMDLLEATVPEDKLNAAKSLGRSILRDLEGRVDDMTRDTITFEQLYLDGLIRLD